jgi:plasmid stability protein
VATLHVRNVPDELYELLRERAAASDRSIGAETVQLLYERLVVGGGRPRPFAVPGLRRRPVGQPGLFTRFTTEARAAVVTGQEEARALGHDHVGTEHLLLGVLAGGVTGLDLEAESVRAQLEPGEARPTGQIPFTPEAKRALELALRSALKEGAALIEPRHMLTGITGTSGRGCEILLTAQPDFAEALVSMQPRAIGLPDTSFRVVQLEGEPEDWEKRLNDVAALGYELVEIVDRRAIFRR